MTNGKLLKKSQWESYDRVYVLGVLREGKWGWEVRWTEDGQEIPRRVLVDRQ